MIFAKLYEKGNQNEVKGFYFYQLLEFPEKSG
jgi:hypothetical protein